MESWRVKQGEAAATLWLDRIRKRTDLGPAGKRAVLDLPFNLRRVEPERYLLHEGERPTSCSFIVSGITYRHKLTKDGERQIVGIDVPGDMISTAHLFLNETDHNVQALTSTVVADFSLRRVQEIAFEHAEIGRALWTEALVSSSIAREWIMNAGRREAHQAIAHLLCEMALRLDATGENNIRAYDLPMTQSQLGDVLGISLVHVNRTLMTLVQGGLVERRRSKMVILDYNALQDVAGFSARYLHLGQHGRDRRRRARAA